MIGARHLERLAESGASACFGSAAAFAVFQGLDAGLGRTSALVAAITAAAFAYSLSRRFLASIEPAMTRFQSDPPMSELLLDEVVAAAPNARVVRLCDSAALPVSRLSPALSGPLANDPVAALPDASQDLRDALNQLRRSLRQA